MSTREIDLGDPLPLDLELGGDRGAALAKMLAPPGPAQLIALPRKAEPRRFSRLRLMDDSPAHYLANSVEETSPMRKGTALHAYLLGQKERVAVYMGGARNEKHKAYQHFLADHPGKCILSPTEAEQVQAMRKSVEAHPLALELLEGEQERVIEWEFAGRRCKGTPDAVKDLPLCRRVTELKATRSAKPARLLAHARWMHWHAQLAWYGDGLDRCSSYPPLECTEHFLVAVESVKPFPVTVLHVDAAVIRKGRQLWRGWWEKLENCEQSNYFPGYSDGIVEWEDDAPREIDFEDDDEAA